MPLSFTIKVEKHYIPVLQFRVPGYGVRTKDDLVHVFITDTAPHGLLALVQRELEDELLDNKLLGNMREVDQYAERLVHDFMFSHVLAGNLKHDKHQEIWRWLGPPIWTNPVDTKK